jgi:hypothetical protein
MTDIKTDELILNKYNNMKTFLAKTAPPIYEYFKDIGLTKFSFFFLNNIKPQIKEKIHSYEQLNYLLLQHGSSLNNSQEYRNM